MAKLRELERALGEGRAEQMASNWDLDGNKLMERWWFAVAPP